MGQHPTPSDPRIQHAATHTRTLLLSRTTDYGCGCTWYNKQCNSFTAMCRRVGGSCVCCTAVLEQVFSSDLRNTETQTQLSYFAQPAPATERSAADPIGISASWPRIRPRDHVDAIR